MQNPILPGFNPDPSICRVGEDYYLVTSSFAFYPGLPVYHSRDLINWELISHAIDTNNISKFHFEDVGDNDGVWAPTIRYHDGIFYISSTMWNSGGNFIITTKDPRGKWSDPVWVPSAPGIDPTLFWDEDGKSYYIGNRYDFKHEWSGQVGIFIQEIDLKNITVGEVSEKKTGLSFKAPTFSLKGEHKILSYGHATNATYAEGPHIYKKGGLYYLLIAEGGSGSYHAVTVHKSDSFFGPYKPQQVNPVLSHRQMGNRYPIQNIGHADLVQTQNGDWYAVCLGNRMIPVPGQEGKSYACPLGRETWLTRVEFQDNQIIFAPEVGYVESELKRPNLPWTPIVKQPEPWYTPLTMPNVHLQKLYSHVWTFEREITDKSNEQGVILFRTINSYYALLKNETSIQLKKVEKGVTCIIAEVPYKEKVVSFCIEADGMNLCFRYNGQQIGDIQSFLPLCDDGKYNKFNGTGVGYIQN
nr:glycoside hydrolase family 43 protein [Bacteroides intestinalis]